MEDILEKQGKQYLNKNEILILLQAIENSEIDIINSYIDNKQLKDKIQTLCDENRFWEERDNIEDEYLSNIASQISEDDYSFLESRITNRASRELICATGNIEYIKRCINTLELDIREKIFLVSATKDEQYIKDFFYANKDKLENWQKANLIIATKNNEFIKECINDESLQLEDSLKAIIIRSTGDIEYIKEFIENKKLDSHATCILIEATKDSEYIRDKIENSDLEISNGQIVNILKTLNDKALIKEYLDGTKLEINDKLELIERIKDVDYIKQFIAINIDSINKDSLIRLIELTKDTNYIYVAISDKTLGLTDKEKTKIISQTKNKELIEKYMQETPNLGDDDRKILELMLNPEALSLERETYKKIELPKGMTIGVEIESEGEYGTRIPKRILKGRWRTKSDGSLENGIEIVSTILGGSEQDSREIYQICDFLEEIGQATSERCGAHVHIGTDFLTNKQAYINLLEIFGNCEEIIYAISNGSNSNIRKGISKYCLPIATKLEEGLLSGNLDSEEEMSRFIEQLQILQGDRFSGINFMNIGTSKNTIEFRTPNGTINPDVWIENINLFGGMIKVAQELSDIQTKGIGELTDEDKVRLMLFSKIKGQETDSRDKLDALLQLTVKDKAPYIERYSKNIVLIQEDEEITETMQKAKASQPLDIRRIGKSIFTGNDAIRGEEITKAETTFYRDVEQVKEGEKSYE